MADSRSGILIAEAFRLIFIFRVGVSILRQIALENRKRRPHTPAVGGQAA